MFSPDISILVADDMGTMRKLVKKSCMELGFHNFTEAPDGASAWEALCSSKPPIGLIISDWNMPNCSGVDFLKRVRADTRYRHLPFILVTAEAEKHQIVEAIKAGVSGYVVKPFTSDALKIQLDQAYKKKL